MHRLSRPGTRGILLCALSAILLISNTALAHGGHHHHRSRFKGNGTWSVSPPDTNGNYTVSGELTVNSSVDLTMSGTGQIKGSSCKTQKKKTCCLTTMNGDFQDTSGNTVDFVFSGRRCQLSDTLETIKGPMKLTGTTGTFSGQTGSGVLQGQDNPQTWDGPVKISGAIHD